MFPLTTRDHTDAREQDSNENHESLATAAPHHVPWPAPRLVLALSPAKVISATKRETEIRKQTKKARKNRRAERFVWAGRARWHARGSPVKRSHLSPTPVLPRERSSRKKGRHCSNDSDGRLRPENPRKPNLVCACVPPSSLQLSILSGG